MGSTFKKVLDPLDLFGLNDKEEEKKEEKKLAAQAAADAKANAVTTTTANNTEMQAVDTDIMKRNSLKGITSPSTQLGVL